MGPSTFKSQKEIMQALIDGKKIRLAGTMAWRRECYLKLDESGKLVDERGHKMNYTFSDPHFWEEWKQPFKTEFYGSFENIVTDYFSNKTSVNIVGDIDKNIHNIFGKKIKVTIEEV